MRKGIRSSLLGVAINLALAIGKCLAGIVGHSFALVADGIESLSNVVSSSVVALGLWVAIKPPDSDHPYGHGKAEPIDAVVVSLALLAAGVAIAIESIIDTATKTAGSTVALSLHTRPDSGQSSAAVDAA